MTAKQKNYIYGRYSVQTDIGKIRLNNGSNIIATINNDIIIEIMYAFKTVYGGKYIFLYFSNSVLYFFILYTF